MEEYFIKAQKNFLCNTSYPLNKENWLKYKVDNYDLFKNENNLNFYIHIPFCKKKCFYCDFTSYANRENMIEKYIYALCNEILAKAILKRNGLL